MIRSGEGSGISTPASNNLSTPHSRPAVVRNFSSGTPIRRILPVAYLAIVMAVVATVLPTSLRPPPDDPTTSAEFSPDAPPDDTQEAILAALGRGQTTGAGAGAGRPGGTDGAAQPRQRGGARNCPYGFGDPPRQIESLYAGPCTQAWEGDNGGATSKNVFRGEVHLALYHSTDGCNGPIPTEPPANESSGNRTMRVLQDYVNASFETYGRRVRFYCMGGGAQEDAVQADEEWKVFAASNHDFPACREFIRRKIPVFCDPPTREDMMRNRPYLWAWQMDRTAMQELGGEYYCKKLAGKPARFAGEASGFRSTTRKLGILTEMSPTTGLTYEPMIPELARECGISEKEIVAITYSAADSADQAATAIARLKLENVTTVVINMKFGNYLLTFEAADGAAYYPEWLIFSPYGLDINIIGTLMPQTQMTQVFGVSGWEWPRAAPETECYRAYKVMDPNNEPNAATCFDLFDIMIQMMNGLQAAGPTLTPETFRDGLHALGHRFYPDKRWAIGGGYDSTDYTYIDNVGEIWWDPEAQDPSGLQGAYRWVRCGERYRKGDMPKEDPLVFRNGSTGPGRDGCR